MEALGAVRERRIEALRASYGSTSDSDSSPKSSKDSRHISNTKESDLLSPPPITLIHSPPPLAYCQTSQASRVRSFPHVEGNYALHVFIPVLIPPVIKKELILALKRVASLVPSLHAVDVDIPLRDMCKDDGLLEQFLGREFHISLGRTVPIRVHQIGLVVTMLRQRLQSQNRYWMDFSKWEVFVNDNQTRSFLSMEVIAGGLSEITRQIHVVNDVYKLHNLPKFYENARPHISLAWALGDISHSLRRAVEELKRHSPDAGSSRKKIFTCKFSGIECKIGKKTYKICKFEGQ